MVGEVQQKTHVLARSLPEGSKGVVNQLFDVRSRADPESRQPHC
jgi:hypothetical protein